MTIVFPGVTLRLSSGTIYLISQSANSQRSISLDTGGKVLSLCLFDLNLHNKSTLHSFQHRETEKFLIKLLVLSHIYNIYIWAGESWTLTSIDSNVRCEREKSHPTVDLPLADNGHYCNNINASTRVYVPWCPLAKWSPSANLRWFAQILRWSAAIFDEVTHKLSCTRDQLNIHEITSPVTIHILSYK